MRYCFICVLKAMCFAGVALIAMQAKAEEIKGAFTISVFVAASSKNTEPMTVTNENGVVTYWY